MFTFRPSTMVACSIRIVILLLPKAFCPPETASRRRGWH